MSFVRFAAAAAALFTVASAAEAAPIISGDYYQDQTLKVCNAVGSCELMFAAVPAGKKLIMTDVGCVTTMTSSSSSISLSVSARQAGNPGSLVSRTNYPTQTLVSVLNGQKRYQAQAKIMEIVLAGEKPRVFTEASPAPASFIVNCTISGRLL